MTLKNKLLTYLGFCPSKESAQRFRVRNNTTTLKQGVIGVGFILILLVGANYIYARAVTVDTSRLFSNIVLGLILVIVMVGGQIIVARKYEYGLWTLAREAFQHNFILVFIIGAPWPGKPHNYGFWFISPTDGWVEIITEVLAISLIIKAVQVMGAGAYFRWRKDKQ
jgi:hypothetical protein